MAENNCKCEWCGKEFYRKRAKIKKHIFCSTECYMRANNKKEIIYKTLTCPYCHKEFEENRARHKFCSNSCSASFYGDLKTEEAKKKKEIERKKKEMISELKQGIKELKARIKEIERYKACQCCGKIFKSEKNRLCCSERCSRRIDNRRRDKRIYRNGKPDLSITLDKLYKRDKGICKLCGKPTYFVDDVQADIYPSIDHITPISKGGLHQWDNVQLAHRGCNDEKGSDSPATAI